MINLVQEKKILLAMIRLHCRQQHKSGQLCEECSSVMEYAAGRLEKCPFGYEKPTCQNCTVHCYKPEMREKIKVIMRYAGPRMIIYHPVMAIRHLIHNKRPRRS